MNMDRTMKKSSRRKCCVEELGCTEANILFLFTSLMKNYSKNKKLDENQTLDKNKSLISVSSSQITRWLILA
jgi:hypothetical protein